ncbi:SDR family oxidoreductase [Streptomyces sp. NBC_00059]|uniref:SDR family oxidoreductase n=1 Tax=Streptomyces sp. NBC_00059 TaxID=2975635 RepID=UPI0022588249|nr:SDR family oxidoreductase [Streptomyces sp. NBC_00059]MCX5415786.1 SDR family oxidoreductase [Streptomyces sp. NBC_00059]
MNDDVLNGAWALVLGASSGMGAAAARLLAARGAHVLGVHFDTAATQPQADALVAELRAHNGTVEFHNANAASRSVRADIVDRLRESAAERGVRVLLHSLAFGTLAPYLRGSDAQKPVEARQLGMTLDVMAHSLVYWTQDLHKAELLRPGAKVFAMTSAGTSRVSANYGPVSAAKCALEAHVRQLAVELAPDGVAVNAIRAGVTPTRSLERIPEHAELLDRARAGNPHRRLTTPEDVAEVITHLALLDSSWLTGNVIGVDGGEVHTV